MNNYPIWWDKTITLYNRYQDPVTDFISWKRTIITGAFVKNANNKVVVGNVVINSNSVIVRIKASDLYKPNREWELLTNDKRNTYFTLKQGDIIVFEEVADTIDEYTNGRRSTDLISKYRATGDCLVISTFQENIGSGRINPHYFIQGD